MAEPDREATEALAHVLGVAVRQHYRSRPIGQATVYEVLNALAFVTATVLAGTGNSSDTASLRAWLDQAIDRNVPEVVRIFAARSHGGHHHG
jgi:LmbE family N-acetylglucosaminyl deacetylase